MKRWHKEQGLTEAGARLATNSALSFAAVLLSICDGDWYVASRVLSEAAFRANELQHRTKAFQKKYLKENA